MLSSQIYCISPGHFSGGPEQHTTKRSGLLKALHGKRAPPGYQVFWVHFSVHSHWSIYLPQIRKLKLQIWSNFAKNIIYRNMNWIGHMLQIYLFFIISEKMLDFAYQTVAHTALHTGVIGCSVNTCHFCYKIYDYAFNLSDALSQMWVITLCIHCR